jgi:hypothetical protein
VTECHTVCVPRVVCKQVPVEVCVQIPVTVRCPPVVHPSAQSVMATEQCTPTPQCTIPACDPCDRRHPLFAWKKRWY